MECERFVLAHIDAGQSFAVETTLRTAASIDQADRAHQHGFGTQMQFIATDSVTENVARVLQRTQGGGHGASERDLRAICAASIANLRGAVATFERVSVYDSTTRWSTPRLVATARDGRVIRYGGSPGWLDMALWGAAH
jgi:predicted ABC-type ATPase